MVQKKAGKKAPKSAKPPAKKPRKIAKLPAKKSSKSGKPAKKTMKKPATNAGSGTASALITARIRELGDWRGEKLALVRKLIHEADPGIVEEWKWMGTPIWSHDGIVCTGESYKEVVKLTFAKGAFLADPHKVFNTGFAGNVRRAIDIRAADEIDASSFRDLIREAVAFNQEHRPKSRRASGADSPGR